MGCTIIPRSAIGFSEYAIWSSSTLRLPKFARRAQGYADEQSQPFNRKNIPHSPHYPNSGFQTTHARPHPSLKAVPDYMPGSGLSTQSQEGYRECEM
jgi:hypothetical protein